MKKVEKQLAVIFIAAILIMGAVIGAYFFIKSTQQFDYHDYRVYKGRIKGINVNFYIIPIQVTTGGLAPVYLRNDPRTIENITADVNPALYGNISKVWLTSDPEIPSESIIAKGQIGTFSATIGLKTDYALTRNATNFNEISCSNSTANTRVIEVRMANETKIYSEGDCIIVQGKDENEMIKASDRFIVIWLERLMIGVRKS
jgi:hypothetical protein